MLQSVLSRISVEVFCLAVPKNFVGETSSVLCFRNLPGARKFMDERGRRQGVSRLSLKIVVSQYRNISERKPSVLRCRKIPVAEKFMRNDPTECIIFVAYYTCGAK